MKKIRIFIFTVVAVLLLLVNNNVSAKGYGVGHNKQNERPNVLIDEIVNNGGYTIGEDEKVVYLTFDCGYENGYTSQILDSLLKNDVRASFFITGHYLTSSTDLVRRMIDEGHLVCNHTSSHKDFSKSTNEEIITDIQTLEKKSKELLDYDMPKIVRPPRGEYTKASLEYLNSLGYKNIFWSLAFKDWDKEKFYGNQYSYNNVMKRIHNGAIILLHTVSKDNAIDLDKILSSLKESGYSFKLTSEL